MLSLKSLPKMAFIYLSIASLPNCGIVHGSENLIQNNNRDDLMVTLSSHEVITALVLMT